MENKILKITLINQLIAMTSIFILLGGIIIILFIVNFKFPYLISSGFFFTLDAIPALILHYRYFKLNKKDYIILQRNEIIIISDGKESIIKTEDIEKFEIYLSPALYQNSEMFILAHEAYHYCLIKTKDSRNFILTSLLHPRLDKILKEFEYPNINKIKEFYPLIR